MSFNQFILREQYIKVQGLGDRLPLMKEQISWEPFRPLVAKIFFDNDKTGGRPHTDESQMLATTTSGTIHWWHASPTGSGRSRMRTESSDQLVHIFAYLSNDHKNPYLHFFHQ